MIPRLETIDLVETLRLPLDCMRNIQQRLKIELLPFAVSRLSYKENLVLCSHIITDRQWLQENLLCLLSNAVKYSSKGEVTISVSLVRKEDCKMTRKPLIQQPTITHKKVKSGTSHGDGLLSKSMIHPENSALLRIVKWMSKEESTSQLLNSVSIMPNSSSKSYRRKPKIAPVFIHEDDLNLFVRFDIEDNGIGLSESAMRDLFSPFKQSQQMAGGTGLGLFSLARRYVLMITSKTNAKQLMIGCMCTLEWKL